MSSVSCPSWRSPISTSSNLLSMNSRKPRSPLAAVVHLDVVQEAVGDRVDRDDLALDRHRLVLRLLEDLHGALAARQLLLGGRVEVGGELREGLHGAELRQVEAEPPRDLLHGLDLGRAADPRHRNPHVHRRPDARVEEVGLQVDLPVGDRDDVGGNVGRDVARLRLDDGERGEGAAAEFVGELGRPFQQARVQVEDVPGVRLTPRGAAEHQRELPVGLGLLGEVVVDDQRVLAPAT